MKYNVKSGADRNEKIFELISGKRCGLLTAASGVDSLGIPTYYKLFERKMLSVLFAPEHGVHSVLQDGGWSGSYLDKETGLPVYDLPARGNPLIDEALSLCDVVLYDIQDVGARFYTYIYCLTYLMEECAKRKIPIIVLDRTNPISGSIQSIAGAILDEEKYSSFVGKYAIPVRYSLTCGEFAKYINSKKHIGCDLQIVECLGWQRDIYMDETNLLWVNPSPNIPSVNCAINYIGTCLIEATNISEGRGTTRPFDIIGAPFIDSSKLCESLNAYKLEGVLFSRSFFTPMFGKWQKESCEGVQINIIDRCSYNPHKTGLCLIKALSLFDGFELKEQSMCLRYGNNALSDLEAFDPISTFVKEQNGLLEFKQEIKPYLIYD